MCVGGWVDEWISDSPRTLLVVVIVSVLSTIMRGKVKFKPNFQPEWW